MENLFVIIGICMILGAFVGFIAGLLGIGGGLIVVPALMYLLPKAGIQPQFVPIIAIATSLANMVLTTFSAATAHYRRRNISLDVAKVLVPGILIGALFSGTIASYIPADHMKKIFAVFVILMAINMARPIKAEGAEGALPSKAVLLGLTIVIGIVSGVLGIGGGVMVIPMLCYFGLQMQKAVGLSSLVSLCVALAGSVGYIIAGWDVTGLPSGTIGYIYIPALLGIAVTSTIVAPLGVKAAMTWPTKKLKLFFAIFLALVGLELIIS
ncbi:sulfite exporter TauE/SafE family protein [Shewanella sp. 202IG2-18]|uniref:sulfite exporter TauE/SafE family protein n=1 Tax=Parashewanella hymeniacidonis TaxID=2807618 RepID=UPI00196001B6|nr:sulfite exporter TauE/SafE family protein [Parashewanella hymeniacidonis]MBM7073822.1 sulfite exporter TauE/SafE family protein [Parashewanella hymeniacidonis]